MDIDKILGKLKDKKYEIKPKRGDYLTDIQEAKGLDWLKEHKDHVYRIVKETNACFPPCREDINQPNLWKPGSWRWFVNSK